MPRPARARTTSTKKPPATSVTAHDEVARRAYDLFLRRNAEHGHDLDDWLQAERELRGMKRRRKSI